MQNNLDKAKIEAKNILTCNICTAKVLDPIICSICKKLFCSKCIKKWFHDRKNYKSPCCQVQASLDDMISLPFMNNFSEFFIKQIDNEKHIDDEMEEDDNFNIFKNDDDRNEISHLDKNSESKILLDYCPKHKDKIIEFICLNCNTNHCSKCLMFINEESKKHKGHKIISKEQKNKFKIDEIKKDIENLSVIMDEIHKNQNKLEMENEIINNYNDFFNNIIKELQNFFFQNIDKKKYELFIKKQSLQNKLKNINNYMDNYENIIHSLISKKDEEGFKLFLQKIKKCRDTSKFNDLNNISINLNSSFRIYMTEFYEGDINENNEIIVEINFNINEINKIVYFKISLQNNDFILMNLLIELNNLQNNNQNKYYANLLVKNKNNIISYSFKENIIQDGFLIISKTLKKDILKSFSDDDNKLHAKLILCEINQNIL